MAIGEQVARRLIARESTQTSAEDVASLGAAAAAYRACERLHRDILRWVGRNGSYALFGRAVAEHRVEPWHARRNALNGRSILCAAVWRSGTG